MTLRRFPDLEAMSAAAADLFAEQARARSEFFVALSGGRTPKRTYEVLAERKDIDWDAVRFFFGDERYVPPSDPSSNEGMFRESFVSRIPHANVVGAYRAEGWQESADAYDRVLKETLSGRGFDLAIQGMGEDGHTASIFPGDPVNETGRLVVATRGPGAVSQRISVTLEFLAKSELVLFLVSGASKAERLAAVLAGKCDCPAATLARNTKNVVWFVDEPAASLID